MSSSPAADAAAAAPEVCEGAILFTDLVGFTEFTDAVGDLEALRVLDRQTDIVSGVLAGWPGARVVKEIGDGLMIWFGSAPTGVDGAVGLRAAIEAARARGEFPLAVRMGMHRGEVVARGDDLVGQAVNIASRVSDLAGPGELLVSEAVVAACRAAGHDVSLQPIGPTVVKGVREPIWLYRLAA